MISLWYLYNMAKLIRFLLRDSSALSYIFFLNTLLYYLLFIFSIS